MRRKLLRLRRHSQYWYSQAFHCHNWFTHLTFCMRHPIIAAEVNKRYRILQRGYGVMDA